MQLQRPYKIAFGFAILVHVMAALFMVIKFTHKQHPLGVKSNVISAFAVNANSLPRAQHKKIKPIKKVVKKVVPKHKKIVKLKPKPKKIVKVHKKTPVVIKKKIAVHHKVKKVPKVSKKFRESEMQKEIARELASSKSVTPTKTAAASFSSVEMTEIDKYKAEIISTISSNWLVPQDLDHEVQAVLLLDIAPGGVVLNVKIAKTSGSDVLDRSAMNAVHKSSPLPVPERVRLFAEFRHIQLTVKPVL